MYLRRIIHQLVSISLKTGYFLQLITETAFLKRVQNVIPIIHLNLKFFTVSRFEYMIYKLNKNYLSEFQLISGYSSDNNLRLKVKLTHD